MNNRISTLLLAVIVICSGACAQAKKTAGVKSGRNYASVVETIAHTDENGNSAPHFMIRWNSTSPPETFYWRAEDGWTNCEVLQAHRPDMKTPYATADIALDKVKKGTLLQVTPVYGGKYPMPAEIPETAKNTLFFKAKKTGWLSLPVKLK